GQFCFNETMLLSGIANVPERWAHIKSAASLTFEENVITSQMHLRSFAGSAQLFQMAVAQLALLVSLVANGLGICNALRYGRCCRSFGNLRIRGTDRHSFCLLFLRTYAEPDK